MTYEDICQILRPSDYWYGVGLSPQGEKVKHLLAEADLRAEADDPVADSGWGSLTPEALAEDKREWQHLMNEGRL